MFISLRSLLDGELPVTAPLVLNPLMAAMAEAAGFPALYLGGGATGYAKVCLEANLGLTEMAQAGMEIASVTQLPIVLDGACGWGDPMHLHRTITTAEAAGFAAIEIEDQILPKRAHHHVGIEHLVPLDLMAAKVREAVAARRDPEFLVIARTNAHDLDDALARAEAYRAAGADLLLVILASIDAAAIDVIADRVGGPLVYLAPTGGLANCGRSLAELGALGYRLIVDAQTPLLAMYEAIKACYAELADGFTITSRPATAWRAVQNDLHQVIGLEAMLAIEKATVEPG